MSGRIKNFIVEQYEKSCFKPNRAVPKIEALSTGVVDITADVILIAEEFKSLTTGQLKSSDFVQQCNNVYDISEQISEALKSDMTSLLNDTLTRIQTIELNDQQYASEIAEAEAALNKSLGIISGLETIKASSGSSTPTPEVAPTPAPTTVTPDSSDSDTPTASANNIDIEGKTPEPTATPKPTPTAEDTIFGAAKDFLNGDASAARISDAAGLINSGVVETAVRGSLGGFESSYDPASISTDNGKYMDNLLGIPLLMQNDPRWAKNKAMSGQDFSAFACGYSSLAMLLSGATGKEIYPPDVISAMKAQVDTNGDGRLDSYIDMNGDGVANVYDAMSFKNGGDGLVTSAITKPEFKNYYGVETNQIHIGEVQKSIDDGVGCLMTTPNHYVPIIPGNNTYVGNDGQTHRTMICLDPYYPQNIKEVTNLNDLNISNTCGGGFGQAWQVMSQDQASTFDFGSYRPIK